MTCKCVYATAENTPAVASGHEMGGYVKEECAECKAERERDEAPSKRSRTFTVFGIYPDTEQRYVDHFESCSWQHAEALAREAAGEDLLIAGTVEGKLTTLDNRTYGHE